MSVSKKNTVVHISFSSYNVCIRPEAGFCCVQYQVCSDPGSFTIAAGATEIADPLVFKAAQDTSCTSDYIDIAGKLEQRVLNRWSKLSEQKSRFFSKVKIKLRLGAQSVTLLSTLRDPTQFRQHQYACNAMFE